MFEKIERASQPAIDPITTKTKTNPPFNRMYSFTTSKPIDPFL